MKYIDKDIKEAMKIGEEALKILEKASTQCAQLLHDVVVVPTMNTDAREKAPKES